MIGLFALFACLSAQVSLAAQVAAGGGHSVLLKDDGTVWTWGINESGQLGDGTSANRYSPGQVLANVQSIAAGDIYTLAIKSDGTLWIWGDGPIGDGTQSDRSTPTQVMSGVASVAAGGGQTLAVKTNGQLWAWGVNSLGQVGNGSTNLQLTPVQIMTGVRVTAAGINHSLAVKTDGTLWSWGFNNNGQLGSGNNSSRSSPGQVMTGVQAVAAGSAHTLALKIDGTLWSWGSNASGQLGDGLSLDRSTPMQIMSGVKSISAGNYHSLAVKNDGTLWVWGDNRSSQLGDGSSGNRTQPVQVMTGVAAASGGYGHTLALRTDGSVWAWGDGTWGQIGNNSAELQPVPMQVTTGQGTPIVVPNSAIKVAAGLASNMLLREDGTLWAWGFNGAAQLGDGTLENRSAPILVMTSVRSVSVGATHTLAVKTDGSLWAWGSNDSGQLGNGTFAAHSLPVKMMTDVKSAVAGARYSLAIRNNGSLWAWGDNGGGQLGDGTRTTRLTPVQVLTNVASVAASAGSAEVLRNSTAIIHTANFTGFDFGSEQHSLAVKNDGSVWAWGSNSEGQLGNGSNVDSLFPIPVMNGAKAVAAGATHSLALSSNGVLAAWGNNASGQVGAQVVNTSAPVVVLSNVTAVSAGTNHSLAIRDDGSVWAWGRNASGQVGNGTKIQQMTPVQVLTGAQAIAGGGDHSIVVRADGRPWAWGANTFGQLGDAGLVARSTPSVVPGLLASGAQVSAVANGGSHTVVLTTNGNVLTFGSNSSGQLGDNTTTDRSTPGQVLAGARAVFAGFDATMAIKTDNTLWQWGRIGAPQGIGGTGGIQPVKQPSQVLTGVQTAAQGDGHALALKTDGSVWVWGQNGSGQLGSGATQSNYSPTQRLTGVKAIAAGKQHSLALKTDGTLWAWGSNEFGQLGDGGTTNRLSPVQVMAGVQSVAAGDNHTVVTAIDGTVWAWGYNFFGQVGDGTKTTRRTPVRIVGASGVAGVRAGGSNSLAIKTDGTILGWGSNYGGMLGPGIVAVSQPSPIANHYIRGAAATSVGGGHVSVVTQDSRLLVWGSNRSGQLGIGRLGESASPILVRDPLAGYNGADLVIEYFNPGITNASGRTGIGHFFMTADPAEAASIDNGGSGAGWARTGRTWRAWMNPSKAPNDAAGVCRFYAAIPNSHFYTADAAECQQLRQQNPSNNASLGWKYEGVAFYTVIPQGGHCSPGYFPIFRSFNNRYSPNAAETDVNHRITSSHTDYQRSTRFLGYADEGVAFCSPIAGSPGADLQASFSYPGASVPAGSPITAEFQFGNNGPGSGDGGSIHAVLPTEVSAWSISCSSQGGATCPQNLTADRLREGLVVTIWPAGSSLRLVATGQPAPASNAADATLSFGATAVNASGSPDPNPTNDSGPVSQTVQKSTGACNYVLNPSSMAVGNEAQSGRLSLVVGSGCSWSATSDAGWLTISPASGTGEAQPGVTIAANTSAAERTGTIRVNGQVLAVSQSGMPCTYTLNPAPVIAGNGAQIIGVSLSTQPSCPWTTQVSIASSPTGGIVVCNPECPGPWLAVTPASGTGSALLSFTFSANSQSGARAASVLVGQTSVPVSQGGMASFGDTPPTPPDGCASLAVASELAPLPFNKTTVERSIAVSADSSCNWRAQKSEDWITLTGSSGTGNGALSYMLQENVVEKDRSATITVKGNSIERVIRITQTRWFNSEVPGEPGGR